MNILASPTDDADYQAAEQQLLIFSLDAQRYALSTQAVVKVFHAAAITPLNTNDRSVEGLLDVQGRIALVLNLRQLLGLPHRALSISDKMILIHHLQRCYVLRVDKVLDTRFYRQTDIISANKIAPELAQLHGVIRIDRDLALIEDLDILFARIATTITELVDNVAVNGG